MNTYPAKYLALFLKDKCILCDNQPKKLGFCHVHCNKECINNIRCNILQCYFLKKLKIVICYILH